VLSVFLENKSDAFKIFKKFKVMFEKTTRKIFGLYDQTKVENTCLMSSNYTVRIIVSIDF
jgi:hypothetical protein